MLKMGNYLKYISFILRELNGSLGDIGVLFPIVIGLSKLGININIVLFLVGLAYVLNGIIYKVPVSVQPMKGISSVVLSVKLNPMVVPFSSIIISLILIILNKFRIFSKFRLDDSFIRGIQFGVGILLVIAAFNLLNINFSDFSSFNFLELLFFVLILVLGLLSNWQIPAILVLLITGVILSFSSFNDFHFGLVSFSKLTLYFNQVYLGIVNNFFEILLISLIIVIIQLPITIANAIYASSKTINDLYNLKVSESKLAFTCSTYNLFIGLLGGVPVCHGSGGITAHFVSGGRTFLTPIFIGSICIFISLLNNIDTLVMNFPDLILSILIFFVGFKHMLFIFKLRQKEQYLAALLTSFAFVIISLNVKNVFYLFKI